jgi:hypothetical protein
VYNLSRVHVCLIGYKKKSKDDLYYVLEANSKKGKKPTPKLIGIGNRKKNRML